MMECKICKKERELRMGVCFACAEAESIIAHGTDMYDVGLDGKPAVTAMEKLMLLHKKGIFKCYSK